MNVSSSQLMKIFKIDKQTLSRWYQKGCPKHSRGVFLLPDVLEWWALNIYEPKLERKDLDENLKTARQKYWKAKAEREEISVSLTKGELIPKKMLSDLWCARIAEIRQGLLNLSDRLPPVLEGKNQKEIKLIVHEEMKQLLNMYSRESKYTPKLKKKIAKRKTKKKIAKET